MEYVRKADVSTHNDISLDISIIFSLLDKKGALVEALQQFKVSHRKHSMCIEYL